MKQHLIAMILGLAAIASNVHAEETALAQGTPAGRDLVVNWAYYDRYCPQAAADRAEDDAIRKVLASYNGGSERLAKVDFEALDRLVAAAGNEAWCSTTEGIITALRASIANLKVVGLFYACR